MREVRWERMFPDELEAAFTACPLVYFAYGLCEPHGPQNALGLDAIGVDLSTRMCRRARRLTVTPDGAVDAELATQPRGVRPADLMGALRDVMGARTTSEDRVLRTHQWIERDGARLEPLEADRATAAETRPQSKGLLNDRGHDPGGDVDDVAHPDAPQSGVRERRIA